MRAIWPYVSLRVLEFNKLMSCVLFELLKVFDGAGTASACSIF